ncbi:membrane protein insertion efficiency factor YidD [Deinococcus peraridilitoris]|uniref:Membrane protein insertion efficiency factor n=1 Tax=Deinococcus peraridilitoris (strain DSM 19664 / LMG 22246 / CIP 109416 / KR-200) TaxID=937777 RepID=L0A3V5_DEIPD|nr:membrane protein insertion efficiency factor YidD [Deinococcus peraridilitoris]AFZ67690.1 protein of unknown function DUF37 [Deinococcus peraridilitoris DSM 19664]
MNTNRFALAGIDGYRRYLSPYKGFRCAHAAFFGGPSCSQAVRDIIEQRGLQDGWSEIQTRFAACRSAYAHLRGAPGRSAWLPGRSGVTTRGVCCCGPIPIPFRCG